MMYDLHLENSLIGNRYHIRRRMRCGSFTELFFGFDQVVNQVVIIKALNVAIKGTPDAELEQKLIEYFATEAEVLNRLQHPHIIKCLAHGSAADLDGRIFHYLVLEYMPGGDLMTLCRGRRLPLPRALGYCHQVCLGLAHAHEHGVIHRDIKPQNLLLEAELKQVKISDFGIAKILRGEDDEITRGIGTETYAPPECFGHQENPANLTPAADVYGLAKTLYVMVSGGSPREFFQRPIAQLPTDIMSQSWAPKLLQVINNATQHDPVDRYATVAAFWEELEPLVQSTAGLDSSDGDEETVITIGVGQRRTVGSALGEEVISAVRVEVPIRAPLSEGPEVNLPVATGSSRPRVEPDQEKPNNVKTRTWTRRLFTTGLAASFIATSFWIHWAISGASRSSLKGVATANLHLRAEPDQDAASYGLIVKDTQVKIVGESRDGLWYEVEATYRKWDDRAFWEGRGWVFKAYIKLDEEQVR